MTMKRLLITADAVGGIWQHTMELCEGLSKHGVECFVMTQGPAPQAWQKQRARSIAGLKLIVATHRLEWMEDPWQQVASARSLIEQLAESLRPDLLHLNSYALASAKVPMPKVVGAHSCVYSWFDGVHRQRPPATFGQYFQEVQRGLRAADCVVAPTEAMLRMLRSQYHVDHDARVIPNGIDLQRCRRAVAKDGRVRAVGRLWDQAKNLRVLTEISRHLPMDVELIGPRKPARSRAGSASRLTITGEIPHGEVLRKIAAADVLVHPALYEPFGLVPLEAAINHTPMVLSDIASLREVWGDAAVYANPRDAVAMAEAVLRIQGSRTLAQHLAGAAYERAQRLYDAKTMAERYLRLYQHLVRAKKASPATEVAA